MYIRVDDNDNILQYPINFEQLRKLYPKVSIPSNPSFWAQFGVYAVAPRDKPAFDPMIERVEEGVPTKAGSQWIQTWQVVALSAEEVAEKAAAAASSAVEAEAKADAFVQQFVGMTPQQVQNFISNQVTDLASARNVLTKLSLIVLALAKYRLRNV